MEYKNRMRLICIALCACLLLGAAPVYAASISEQEAVDLVFGQLRDRFAPPEDPPSDKDAVIGFSDAEVIQYFVEVALYGEYDGYRGYLLRYEEPLT